MPTFALIYVHFKAFLSCFLQYIWGNMFDVQHFLTLHLAFCRESPLLQWSPIMAPFATMLRPDGWREFHGTQVIGRTGSFVSSSTWWSRTEEEEGRQFSLTLPHRLDFKQQVDIKLKRLFLAISPNERVLSVSHDHTGVTHECGHTCAVTLTKSNWDVRVNWPRPKPHCTDNNRKIIRCF